MTKGTTGPKMQRVLYIFGCFEVGGTESHFMSLVAKLSEIKKSLFIIAPPPPHQMQMLTSIFERDQIRFSPKRPRIPVLKQLLILRDVVRFVRSERPDIIHAYFFWGEVIGVLAALITGIRVVQNKENVRSEGWFPLRLLVIAANRFSSAIIIVSNAACKELGPKEFCPVHKSVVIHNGIDVDGFSSHGAKCGPEVVISMVARFVKQKDPETLIRALASLAHILNLSCVFAGDGSLRPTMERLAKHLGLGGRIKFLGESTAVSEVLSKSDIFVLSSHYEGLPISILEAMACELPIIASDVGGVPELVAHGKTGFLVPPRNPYEMARAIAVLAADHQLRREMGRRGRMCVMQNFNIAETAEKYRAVYNSLISESFR